MNKPLSGAPAATQAMPEPAVIPIPDWSTIDEDVSKISAWLALVAAAADDPRQEQAQQLLMPVENSGNSSLLHIARIAYDYAYQREGASGEAVEAHRGTMIDLIYDHSDDLGDQTSPLYFREPCPLMVVLETADYRRRLASYEPGELWSSRQLARLARINETAADDLLIDQGLHLGFMGLSLRERSEMTTGDILYECAQDWVVGDLNVPEWLAARPGFLPTQPDAAVSSKSRDPVAAV